MPQNNSSCVFCSVNLSGWVVYCLFFLSNSRNLRTFICSFPIWALCQQSPCCAGGVGMNSSKNGWHFSFLTCYNTYWWMLTYLDFEQLSKIYHFGSPLLVFSVAVKDPEIWCPFALKSPCWVGNSWNYRAWLTQSMKFTKEKAHVWMLN